MPTDFLDPRTCAEGHNVFFLITGIDIGHTEEIGTVINDISNIWRLLLEPRLGPLTGLSSFIFSGVMSGTEVV
jgi:hypothetical protein